ncbi:MAG: hypothetical protein INQ03_08745 [Candidatus Heimdallarchaeota archaeon]|nr:hypothetical protein [Candidatus Heimdallarchaeota archaeon]
MSEFDQFDGLDDLLDDFDDEDFGLNLQPDIPSSNILYIGTEEYYSSVERKLKNFTGIKLQFQDNVEDAIQSLLQEVFAIVFIENYPEKYDSVTVSRVVRVNHPLARIVILSQLKNSNYVGSIINRGSVDGFIHLKSCTRKRLSDAVTEHLAKHEINKMIVRYISDPPKLSGASYLLLDPSLSFDVDTPVKYVGLMITHNSVPRFSEFFEELLAKDEVLFSGYLSGISMLGSSLFDSNEPMKEINFGGISVVMRFIEQYQFFIFVRNLTNQNVGDAEALITKVINEILSSIDTELRASQTLKDVALQKMNKILKQFEDANDFTLNILPDLIQYNEHIMLYGTDYENQEGIKSYLERKFNFRVYNATSKTECIEELKSKTYEVLLLDAAITEMEPTDFAEYAKDISPQLQIIYRIRDKRASDPIIDALNCTNISFLTSYKSSYKSLSKEVHSAIKKAIEIKQQSRMGLQSSHNQAIVAKSMIRGNESKYLAEAVPELHGIFITLDAELLYAYQPHRDNLMKYDQELLAGIVAALDSIGAEALGTDNIGKIEMGGAHVLIQSREKYHFGFLIQNLEANTSVVLSKDLTQCTEEFYTIIKKYKKDTERNPKLAMEADKFNEFFISKFE